MCFYEFDCWFKLNAGGKVSLLMPNVDVWVEIDGRDVGVDLLFNLVSSWISSSSIRLYLNDFIKYKIAATFNRTPKKKKSFKKEKKKKTVSYQRLWSQHVRIWR